MRRAFKTVSLFLTGCWLYSPLAVLASDASRICNGAPGLGGGNACKPDIGKQLDGAGGFISTIVNTILFLAGSIAVIVLVFGGFRYVTSTGDASRIKQAKETIMYAIVGIIVAILAYAIVAFTVNRLS